MFRPPAVVAASGAAQGIGDGTPDRLRTIARGSDRNGLYPRGTALSCAEGST